MEKETSEAKNNKVENEEECKDKDDDEWQESAIDKDIEWIKDVAGSLAILPLLSFIETVYRVGRTIWKDDNAFCDKCDNIISKLIEFQEKKDCDFFTYLLTNEMLTIAEIEDIVRQSDAMFEQTQQNTNTNENTNENTNINIFFFEPNEKCKQYFVSRKANFVALPCTKAAKIFQKEKVNYGKSDNSTKELTIAEMRQYIHEAKRRLFVTAFEYQGLMTQSRYRSENGDIPAMRLEMENKILQMCLDVLTQGLSKMQQFETAQSQKNSVNSNNNKNKNKNDNI